MDLWILDMPWSFPKWQEITKIHHGLFPEYDQLLPTIGKAIVWTRQDAQDVRSFFEHYKSLSTDAERATFVTQSRGAILPGRSVWLKFVAKGWSKWNIHSIIINQFNLHNIHPLKLMLAENTVTDWPAATLYLPEALDSIGVDLFGPEVLSPISDRLPSTIRDCVRMLSQQTWLHIRKQVERSRKKINVLERNALQLVSGKFLKTCATIILFYFVKGLGQSNLKKAEVRKAIHAVGKWRNVAEILCTQDNLSKIDSIMLDLNTTLESFGILRNPSKQGGRHGRS